MGCPIGINSLAKHFAILNNKHDVNKFGMSLSGANIADEILFAIDCFKKKRQCLNDAVLDTLHKMDINVVNRISFFCFCGKNSR